MEFRSEGNLAVAEERFETLLSSSPDYVPAYFRLGELFAEQDRQEEARDVLTRGIDTARRTGDLHAAGEMTEFLAGISGAP